MRKASILLLAAIILAGCTTTTSTETEIDVLASTYPFYDITSHITPSNISVSYLVPPSVSPHHFDPTPSDRAKITSAEAIVTTGVAMEQWERSMTADTDAYIINGSRAVELQPAVGDSHESEYDEQGRDHDEDHDHGSIDPHYWLAPENAITIAGTIRDALIEQYPEQEQAIREQSSSYIQDLESLHQTYSTRLSDCEHDTVLTSHAAFGYLADAYGFEQVPILGISATAEPSPQEVQTLVDTAQQEGIDTVFYDTSGDRSMAETIANEIDGEIRPLNPVMGIDDPASQSYITIMEQNLEELTEALQCQ
ncbi:MAG: zinc ABC transporter substrate-binding protein [Candidatus Nanohaloarchaeota archaeon QJJ-5]|nr:zinc ABC transporter substrate-binding protein [Candidatus Nanohaloarchaeota archaeon QJJ-5]